MPTPLTYTCKLNLCKTTRLTSVSHILLKDIMNYISTFLEKYLLLLKNMNKYSGGAILR